MLNIETEEITDPNWWKQALEEIEETKRRMHGKLNWTPWGHIDELKKPENHDFVKNLYKKGKVCKEFLTRLEIEVPE